MGLLDDAIREHLELKRRHGADASEVAKQEQEALGPARRGPEPLDVPPAPREEREREPASDAEEPSAPDEPSPPAHEEPDAEADELACEAPPREPDPDPQATVAFDAADLEEAQRRPSRRELEEEEEEPEPSALGEGAEEDVLEETPDFLQETPEHDRLWFEQRPPRDFDFDG